MLKKILLVAISLGINQTSFSMESQKSPKTYRIKESKKEAKAEAGSLGENFKPYYCDFCNAITKENFSFDTKEDLNAHIENIHKFCRFCKRQFRNVEYLKNHLYKEHKLALDMEELEQDEAKK